MTTGTDWADISAEALAEQVRELTRVRLLDAGVAPGALDAGYHRSHPFAVRLGSPRLPGATALVSIVGVDRFALSCRSARGECLCHGATWSGAELVRGMAS